MYAKKSKKTPKNGFYYFMLDYQEANHIPDLRKVAIYAGPLWNKMEQDDRAPFEKMAANAKSKNSPEKLTSQGIPVSEIVRLKKEEEDNKEQVLEDIRNMVDELMINEDVLKKHLFYFLHINIYCRTDKGYVVPAELGLSEFSLQEGVKRVYSTFIGIREIPQGYSCTAKTHGDSTHRIPLPPFSKANKDASDIVFKMRRFIDGKSVDGFDYVDWSSERPLIMFTTRKEINMARECIEAIKQDSMLRCSLPFKVYPLEDLFLHLHNASAISRGEPTLNATMIDSELEKDVHSYCPGLACDFHVEKDVEPCCSRSIVHRWGFYVADFICKFYGIELIDMKHCKPNSKRDHLAKIQPTLSLISDLHYKSRRSNKRREDGGKTFKRGGRRHSPDRDRGGNNSRNRDKRGRREDDSRDNSPSGSSWRDESPHTKAGKGWKKSKRNNRNRRGEMPIPRMEDYENDSDDSQGSEPPFNWNNGPPNNTPPPNSNGPWPNATPPPNCGPSPNMQWQNNFPGPSNSNGPCGPPSLVNGPQYFHGMGPEFNSPPPQNSLPPGAVNGPPGLNGPPPFNGPPTGFGSPPGLNLNGPPPFDGPPTGFGSPPGLNCPPPGFNGPSGINGPPPNFNAPPPIGPNGFPIGPNQCGNGPNGYQIGPNGFSMGPNQDRNGPNGQPMGPNGFPMGLNQGGNGPNGHQIGPNGFPMGPNQGGNGHNVQQLGPNGFPMGPNQGGNGPNGPPIIPNGFYMGPNGPQQGLNGQIVPNNDVPLGPNGHSFAPQQGINRPNGPIMGPNGFPFNSAPPPSQNIQQNQPNGPNGFITGPNILPGLNGPPPGYNIGPNGTPPELINGHIRLNNTSPEFNGLSGPNCTSSGFNVVPNSHLNEPVMTMNGPPPPLLACVIPPPCVSNFMMPPPKQLPSVEDNATSVSPPNTVNHCGHVATDWQNNSQQHNWQQNNANANCQNCSSHAPNNSQLPTPPPSLNVQHNNSGVPMNWNLQQQWQQKEGIPQVHVNPPVGTSQQGNINPQVHVSLQVGTNPQAGENLQARLSRHVTPWPNTPVVSKDTSTHTSSIGSDTSANQLTPASPPIQLPTAPINIPTLREQQIVKPRTVTIQNSYQEKKGNPSINKNQPVYFFNRDPRVKDDENIRDPRVRERQNQKQTENNDKEGNKETERSMGTGINKSNEREFDNSYDKYYNKSYDKNNYKSYDKGYDKDKRYDRSYDRGYERRYDRSSERDYDNERQVDKYGRDIRSREYDYHDRRYYDTRDSSRKSYKEPYHRNDKSKYKKRSKDRRRRSSSLSSNSELEDKMTEKEEEIIKNKNIKQEINIKQEPQEPENNIENGFKEFKLIKIDM